MLTPHVRMPVSGDIVMKVSGASMPITGVSMPVSDVSMPVSGDVSFP
jgi:hypothetical protein